MALSEIKVLVLMHSVVVHAEWALHGGDRASVLNEKAIKGLQIYMYEGEPFELKLQLC